MNKEDFQKLIRQKGKELYRNMPWRSDTSPYYVLVSELMLQQTQVERVVPKFNEFIKCFPTVTVLASASLSDVLTVWNGLGYNRRAKFLHEAAKKIVNDFGNVIPSTAEELTSLPGVGANTAAAILAYSFNQPIVFIETNIRTVYFHHFFGDNQKVSDKELHRIVEATLDYDHPRQWYQALMDYGSYLKKQGMGRINKSAHYKKQSLLKGSLREVRGQIIRTLTSGDMNETKLKTAIQADERFDIALGGLIKDGLVGRTKTILHLTK